MHARLEKSIDQKTTREMITPMYMCTARPLIKLRSTCEKAVVPMIS